jgi:hypothetical protein
MITYSTGAPRRRSLLGLVSNLTFEAKTFIRQEVQLAKAELSEKISKLGRNAITLAVGGFVAYAGLIVLLIGLGLLLGLAFENAGLSPAMAGFLGLGAVGLLVLVTGCVLLLKGVRTLSRESLAPERTVQTLKELRGEEEDYYSEHYREEDGENGEEPSTDELQARVEATENRMGETLEELGYRLSPSHINAEVKTRIQGNPFGYGLVALGVGVVSGLMLRSKLRRDRN